MREVLKYLSKLVIFVGVAVLLSSCGQQPADPQPVQVESKPLTWPSLARVHFLAKEMSQHAPDTNIEKPWAYLVEETESLSDVPDGIMNPLGVKSGLEQVMGLVGDSAPGQESLAAYQTSLKSLVSASGLVLDTEDGHVCAAHGGGGANIEGAHHGLMAPITSDGLSGWVELRLHADGSIECWLGEDRKMQLPLDLPLDTELTVEYIVSGEALSLKVRDAEQNPSKDGLPNVRDGATNYFFSPTGGKQGNVVVRGEKIQTSFFNLLPAHE